MNNIAVGHCGKCGAPYFAPEHWMSITPPPMTPSCACWNLPKTYTSTSTTCDFTIESPKDGAEGSKG